MNNLKRQNIAIIRRFLTDKQKKVITGSISDIADKYGLRVLSVSSSLKRVAKEPLPKYLLNWGSTKEPGWLMGLPFGLAAGYTVLNRFQNVSLAVNKLDTYRILRDTGVSVLQHTTSMSRAEDWIVNGSSVYCRTLLRSSKGSGIVIAEQKSQLVLSPLYTKAYPGNREYRIHVFDGKVIDIQIKRKRTKQHLEDMGLELNSGIKNMDNGWVFCRSRCRRNPKMEETAILAVKALGLTFGAVDMLGVVVNGELTDHRVCEVNTAPAIKGSTLDSYAEAINLFIDPTSKRIKKLTSEIDGFNQKQVGANPIHYWGSVSPAPPVSPQAPPVTMVASAFEGG